MNKSISDLHQLCVNHVVTVLRHSVLHWHGLAYEHFHKLNKSTAVPFSSTPEKLGETWKCSFISTLRPTVHTNASQKRSENAPRGSNQRNLKTPTLRSGQVWTFWKRNLLRTMASRESLFPSNRHMYKSKMTGTWLSGFQISPPYCEISLAYIAWTRS